MAKGTKVSIFLTVIGLCVCVFELGLLWRFHVGIVIEVLGCAPKGTK